MFELLFPAAFMEMILMSTLCLFVWSKHVYCSISDLSTSTQLPAGSSQGAQLTFECDVHFSLYALGRSFSIYPSDASRHVAVRIDKQHQELTFASDGFQVRVMK